MKTFFFFFIFIFALFAINVSNAQTAKTATLQGPPPKIVIDGDAKEWGDSLRYYDKENKIGYSLANDKENLYMIMRIKDRTQQIRALQEGVTFSVDTHGKKRNTYSITFPVNVRGSSDFNYRMVNAGAVTQKDRDKLAGDRIVSLRGIKVDGFKDMENGLLTTDNHGILAAVNYDENGNLVCEAVVPLKSFHVDDLTKNEWAFNFQVNSIKMPQVTVIETITTETRSSNSIPGSATSPGRGGFRSTRTDAGGSNIQAGPSNYYRSDDFWVKFFLAK